MPWLASLLATLFGGLASFFAQWLTKKTALATAAVATFTALTVALYSALSAIIGGVMTSFPAGGSVVASIIWMAVPDNAPACISAAVATDTAIALYCWNAQNLKLVATVN